MDNKELLENLRKENSQRKRPFRREPFKCTFCKMEFYHHSPFQSHLRVFHNTEATCRLCNEHLDSNEDVKNHMKSRHGYSQVFTCECCNWTFETELDCLAHSSLMSSTGKPGPQKVIARNYLRPFVREKDSEERVGEVLKTLNSRKNEAKMKKEKVEKEKEKEKEKEDPKKIENLHDAIGLILNSGQIDQEQLTTVSYWEKVVMTAISILKASGIPGPYIVDSELNNASIEEDVENNQ